MANSTASVNTTSMYNTPQAVDDFYSVMEADTLGILKFDVMSNDLGGNAKSLYSVTDQTDSGAVIYNTSDLISKDTASWTGTAGGWEPTGQGGSIRINNGKLEYLVSSGLQARIDSLGVGETITDRVTYTIQLGNGTLSIAEATISFSGTNDAPVISIVGSDSAAASFNETNGGLSKTGTLTVTDADTTDQVSSTVTGVTTNGPTGGLSNDALKAMLTLSPGTLEANSDAHNNLEWNFNSGNQAFNFLAVGETLTLTYAIQVSDGHTGGTDTKNITVTIHGTNDAPVLTGTAATLAHGTEDTGYTITATDLLAGFTDVDGDTLSVSGLSANHGTLVDNLDGTWTFTPTANYNGPVDLSYNVVDGHGGSTAATQSFVLDAIADAAVIGGVDAGSVTEDAALTTAQGQLTLSDPDGPTSFVATSQSGTYGNFSMGSDGLWTYSLLNGDPDTNALNDNDHKTETFAVQSADGTSHNVVITVNGHSDFTYVAPTVFTGTGDPNDNDNAVVSGANSQTGTSASETFTGSANNDKIAGGAGDDTINAGDGNDNQLYGQAGNDIINGGIGADNIYGGSGNDYLYGYQAPAASSSVQDGADDIYGGSGSDQIFGQNSGDVIVGGFGADTLTGGTGADTFRYLDVRDTGDTITDFSQAQSDRIDLTALYTGSVNGSVLIFDDVLATAGAVAEGHVGYAYDAGANVTTVYVGVNAAYGADLEIKLNGNIDLAADDFLL